MEMGSSSIPVSGAASDSLNGLKFGKKIYFEDLGGDAVSVPKNSLPASASSSSPLSAAAAQASAMAAAAAAGTRKGRGVVHGWQPPRCQVEGCRADLSGVKAYYCRHKVCGLHSKASKVVVAGMEQRFCQQCSRFHQLSEFDQCKRSCRRRLAGHNERRRKPPVGPLSSRYGRLPSFHDTSHSGSFLVDFTSYPREPGRDVWPTVRAGDQVPSNQSSTAGKYHQQLWQGSLEVPSTGVSSHVSTGGLPPLSRPDIPPAEFFAGTSSNSGCALSLLSTHSQQWDPRNRTLGIAPDTFMTAEGVSIAQPSPHAAAVSNAFVGGAWCSKGHEAASSSHGIQRGSGLRHVASEPISDGFAGELELAQQGGRQYMELGQSRAYGSSSSSQVNWSL